MACLTGVRAARLLHGLISTTAKRACTTSSIKFRAPASRYFIQWMTYGRGLSGGAAARNEVNLQQKSSLEIQYENEIKVYERGKRMLALMMDKDPDTFTDKDVEEALAYLLPTGLFAKDARPIMKHPLDLLPKIKGPQVDKDGRPLSAGFYTGCATYYDKIYEIGEREAYLMSLMTKSTFEDDDDLLNIKAEEDSDSSKSDQESDQVPIRWKTKIEIEDLLQDKLTDKQYDYIIIRLKRLMQFPNSSHIHDFIQRYQKNIEYMRIRVKINPLSSDGIAYAVGKRKTAVARVQVKQGTGVVQVNQRDFLKYFPQLIHREQVLYPLFVLKLLNSFDVSCHVVGGGLSGQAGAVRLGIARALLSFNAEYKEDLDKVGLLVRDPRVVERKKPGQKKARRKFAWVKR